VCHELIRLTNLLTQSEENIPMADNSKKAVNKMANSKKDEHIYIEVIF